MSLWNNILNNLPEVQGPTQKRLSFREKLKWTGIILILFFVLGLVPLFGLGDNQIQQFEILSIILGASFGSLISLGIGPIVTASIVLQLLNGSGILRFDLTTSDGKRRFQGVQKMLAFGFVVFEGFIYVFMGGLAPPPELIGTAVYSQLQLLLVFQLILGGLLIMYMDEVVSKWGFGSGLSLFIAAGVSQSIFIQVFSPFGSSANPEQPSGAIPQLFLALSGGDTMTASIMFALLVATIIVFVMSVYSQAMKIEIPLSFGRIRGHGIRWPLNFIYTSNIPVILIAALLANIQLWSRLFQNWVGANSSSIMGWISIHIIGQTDSVHAGSGIVQWATPPNIVQGIIQQSVTPSDIGNAAGYAFLMICGAVVFAWFWMQTAGMDARSQARQIMASGLQIPGFRKDQRILERLLDRYIKPLTVMGAIAVGILAAFADLSGAFGSGTGLLLTVMIVYRLYEEIARQHMMDMNPLLRRFMGG